MAMGFITGASGTLGGFVMQALKRDAGVRHWGSKASVTGAVGLLDRVKLDVVEAGILTGHTDLGRAAAARWRASGDHHRHR